MDIETWLPRGVEDGKLVAGERAKWYLNLEGYKNVLLKLMVVIDSEYVECR